MGALEVTAHLQAGQKIFNNDYKNPDMLPKVNKAGAIEEYLTLFCGVIRVPFAYIIRKNMIVQTYSNYPMYATPDDKIINRVLHLPSDKSKILFGA